MRAEYTQLQQRKCHEKEMMRVGQGSLIRIRIQIQIIDMNLISSVDARNGKVGRSNSTFCPIPHSCTSNDGKQRMEITTVYYHLPFYNQQTI